MTNLAKKMINVQEKDIKIVQQILEKFIPQTPVWAFGSRIKGTAKSYSDLDLVIVGEGKIPVAIYYQIQDAFEESDLPFRVDILDWHRISTEFQDLILQQYEVISRRSAG